MNPTLLPPDPGSAAVAGWKSRFGPAAILAGWFAITRVEVLIPTSVLRPLPPLSLATLRALQLTDPPAISTVARLLHLGENRIASVFEELADLALIDDCSPVGLTGWGRTALETGERFDSSPERRTLAFRNGAILPFPTAWGLTPLGLPAEAEPQVAVQWVRDAGFVRLARGWHAVPTVRADWLPLVVASFGPPRVEVFLAELPEWTVPTEPCCSLDGERARVVFPELSSSETEFVRRWSV